MSTAKHVEPTKSVPAAVAAAAARAEELHKQVYPQPQEPAASSADPTPTQGAAHGEPQTPPTHPAPAQVDDKAWEHKYNSMRGRFDRSQEQIRGLNEQVANMQAVITSMQQPPAPTELRAESLLTPEEVENYGEEFLNVVGKRAKEQLSPEVQALKQQVASLQSRLEAVTGSVVQNARTGMFTQLDERCPRWRELNDDQNFLAWLALPDPYSGAIRHDLLKAAYERNSTPQVLAFFNGFLAEEAATAPIGATPDLTAVQPTVQKVPLETLAAPGRAKTAASIPAEKPIITRAQISQFYVDKSAGKYRGKDAEAAALETQIFEAQREGRIR